MIYIPDNNIFNKFTWFTTIFVLCTVLCAIYDLISKGNWYILLALYNNVAFIDTDTIFTDSADMVYPLTSLDVICHELGHAVTQWHGGDMEYNGEAGSINEAYSDILGELTSNTT